MGKIYTTNLGSINDLFWQREGQIRQLMGNLQINEVREDARFEATVNRIKSQILLTPATIGKPVIAGNRQETRQIPREHQMMYGRERTVNIATVNFPTTGSGELFEHRTGDSLTITNIYTPGYNNIAMDIEVPVLDKAQVLAAADREIETTRTVIAQNNPHVTAWSQRISAQIDNMAAQKRKELMDLYS